MSLDLCCVAFGLTPELHEKTGILLFSIVTFTSTLFFLWALALKWGKGEALGACIFPRTS